MHKIAAAFTVSLLAALAGPPAAEARPFSASRVPAAAEGVIHIDLDTLRRSRLWTILEAKAGIDELEKEIRLEAPKGWSKADVDLVVEIIDTAQSITFWVDASETGALLVQVPKAAAAERRLGKLATARRTLRGVTLYRMSHGGGDEGYVARQGDTLILGDEAEAVAISAAVLQGKSKSLPPGRLGASSTQGDIFFIAGFRGHIMNALRQNAQARTLGADIRSVSLHGGETRQHIFFSARVQTGSAATAQKLSSIAAGLSALVSMAGDEPELAAIAQGLSVSHQGTTVTARLEIAHDTFRKLLEK